MHVHVLVWVHLSGCVHMCDHRLCVLLCACSYLCAGVCVRRCASVHKYCKYASKANSFSSEQAKFLSPKGKVLCEFVNPGQRQWLLSLKEGGGKGGTDERESKRERQNRLRHIGLSLFPFSTVFATTGVDLDREEG